MQQPTKVPQAPQAPSALEAPEPYVVELPPPGVPRTPQEVRALRIRMDDLKEQLQDAATRRRTNSEQLLTADPAARPGTLERLRILDERIHQIEKDITTTGAQLTAAPPSALVSSSAPPFRPDELAAKFAQDLVPIVAILSVFVLGPFALAISRMIWKRTSPPAARPAIPSEAMQRLDHLQQAVDTIAIEVERISEGQRFVTKLLYEERPALAAGTAQKAAQGEP